MLARIGCLRPPGPPLAPAWLLASPGHEATPCDPWAAKQKPDTCKSCRCWSCDCASNWSKYR